MVFSQLLQRGGPHKESLIHYMHLYNMLCWSGLVCFHTISSQHCVKNIRLILQSYGVSLMFLIIFKTWRHAICFFHRAMEAKAHLYTYIYIYTHIHMQINWGFTMIYLWKRVVFQSSDGTPASPGGSGKPEPSLGRGPFDLDRFTGLPSPLELEEFYLFLGVLGTCSCQKKETPE